MWQTIVTIIVLVGAAVYVTRHFLKIYRTGKDPACSGCGCSESCAAKPGGNEACADQSPPGGA